MRPGCFRVASQAWTFARNSFFSLNFRCSGAIRSIYLVEHGHTGSASGSIGLDEIFQLTGRAVVWHQPNSNPRQVTTSLNADPTRSGLLWNLDVDFAKLTSYGLPSALGIFVRINNNPDRFSVFNQDLADNGLQQLVYSTLLIDTELRIALELYAAFKCNPVPQLKDDMQIILAFDQKNPVGCLAIPHRTSIPCSAAIRRCFSGYSTAPVSPSRRTTRARALSTSSVSPEASANPLTQSKLCVVART